MYPDRRIHTYIIEKAFDIQDSLRIGAGKTGGSFGVGHVLSPDVPGEQVVAVLAAGLLQQVPDMELDGVFRDGQEAAARIAQRPENGQQKAKAELINIESITHIAAAGKSPPLQKQKDNQLNF